MFPGKLAYGYNYFGLVFTLVGEEARVHLKRLGEGCVISLIISTSQAPSS